ncbi:MAG: TIGR00159 family protein [Candidatus Melainabacteria bacterium]|nr:TIGR00159 family protein [Candidatus Melainabacteria bacterium]
MDLLTQIALDLHKLASTTLTAGWAPILRYLSEILIILYAVIWIRSRIRGTQAEHLVKGVMVLVLICLVSWLAGFTLITSLLQQIIPAAVLALLIIFQPEIRRGLGYLGRGKTFRLDLSLVDSHKEKSRHTIWEIISAVRELSRTKVGALIVVEPPQGERDYLSPGTPVNAEVSSTLLLSIFFPNSPLHDGAVIIRQDKIVSAGVILPMTDNPKLSYKYGTRHRAAIGLSEIYDGLCIVVSEETGAISAASRGMLVKYTSSDDLADPISYIYYQDTENKAPSPLQLFLSLFSKSKKAEQATPSSVNVPSLEAALETHQPGLLETEDRTTST